MSRRTSGVGGLRALRRDRGLVGWLAGALVTVLLTAAIPVTTSAFTATVTNTADSATAKSRFLCADTFAGQRRKQQAYFEFAFDEASGATTAQDSSDAGDTGTYVGSNTKDTASPSACPYDAGGAYQLDGSTSRVITSRAYEAVLTSFSIEVWFKTTATGKLVGFETNVDGNSGEWDRHLHVGADGLLVYGVYDGGTRTLTSAQAVDDGVWHHAVGTTSPSGSVLYMDGVKVAENAAFTSAWHYTGYWRVGQGQLGGWPDAPSDSGNSWFTGSVRFAAAYPYVLTADEVASAWSIGQPGLRTVKPVKPTRPITDPGTATATETAVPASSAPAASDSAATTAQAEPSSASTLDEDGGAVSMAG